MMKALLENQVVVYAVMAALIFGLTQGLKWLFIKPFTNKIKNEKARKAVNTTIYFIPYALGILFEFVYAVLLVHSEFRAHLLALHWQEFQHLQPLHRHRGWQSGKGTDGQCCRGRRGKQGRFPQTQRVLGKG